MMQAPWQTPQQAGPQMPPWMQPWQRPAWMPPPVQRAEPIMSPEEERSLLSRVMSGVQHVAQAFGKPSAAAQGLMYGMAGGRGPQAGLPALWNLLPFSDTLGVTDPEQRITGRQTLTQMGIAPPNTPGFDWWDVPSFGFEIGTDPLFWGTGPLAATRLGAGAAAKGTAAASKALKAMGSTDDVARAATKFLGRLGGKASGGQKILRNTPLDIAQQLRSGERSLMGARLPFQRTPFASLHDIPGIGPAIDRGAARVVEALAYHPVLGKPLQGLRYLTSPVAGSVPMKLHRLRDEWWSTMQANRDKLLDMIPTYAAGHRKLFERFSAIAKHHGQAGDSRSFREFLGMMAEVKQGLPEPAAIQGRLREFLRVGSDAPLEQIDHASEGIGQLMYGWLDTQEKVKDTLYEYVLSLGGRGELLDDLYVRHSVRRTGHALSYKKEARASRRARQRGKAYSPEPRNRLYRNVPGGRRTVDQMSMDRVFDGSGPELEKALQELNVTATENLTRRQLWGRYVTEKYLRPAAMDDVRRGLISAEDANKRLTEYWLTPTERLVRKKGKVIVKQGPTLAEELGLHMRKMPEAVRREGIFTRSMLEDTMDYFGSLVDRASTLQTAHSFLHNAAGVEVAGSGPLLTRAWSRAGFRVGKDGGDAAASSGLYKFLYEQFPGEKLGQAMKEAGAKSPGELLARLRLRPGADDALKGFAQIMVPGEEGAVLEMFDKVTALWKGWQTIPFSAFHTRNWVSGWWQAITDGHVGPAELARAHTDIARHYFGRIFGSKPGKKVIKELDHAETIEKLGLIEGHGPMVDIASEAAAEAAARGGRSLGAAIKEGGWHNINPFAMRGAWGQATAEQVAKGAVSKQNILAETGERMYGMVEAMNRGGYALALLRKGYDPAYVKHLVMRSQFNYSELAPLEKSVARRMIPFYTWLRKNLPYQLAKLLERPGGLHAQTLRAFNKAIGSERDYTPTFLRETVGLRTPFVEQKPEATHFIRQVGLPFEDLNRLAFVEGRPDVPRTMEKLLSNLHPGLTLPLESLAGRQFFTGRKLKDLQPLTGVPFLDRLLFSSPASRVIRTGRGVIDPRKTAWQKALNLTTGLRTGTYDLEKYRMIDQQNALRDILSGAPEIREGQYYMVPERYKTGENYPELQRKMRQVGKLSRAIKTLREKREKEGKP